MPIALAIIGLAMVIAGARGTAPALGQQIASDFSGGFLKWLGVIFILGFIGYIPVLKTPSRALLVLILLAFVLKNGGILEQIPAAFAADPGEDGSTQVTYTPSPSSSGGGGFFGDIFKAVLGLGIKASTG